MKISLFFLCLLFVTKLAHAQETGKRDYVPPSPNAMTFVKYGEYPVDQSTGVPAINIPLYTIDLGDFQFPISASFHASGRKVSMDFSPLGLNWSLNAYGMISREIRGETDDALHNQDSAAMRESYYAPAVPVNRYSRKESYEKMLRLAGEHPSNYRIDGEYDIYTLSINGLSAQFIILPNNNVHLLTAFPYKIEKTGLYNFLVTDERGVKYEFFPGESFSGGLGTSSWLIKKITTPTKREIRFIYSDVSIGSPTGMTGNYTYSDRMTIGDNLHYLSGGPLENSVPYSQVMGLRFYNEVNVREYSMAYLTSIEYDFGSVSFTYNPANILLTNISIQNTAGLPLRNIEFQTGTFLTTPANAPDLPNNNSKTVSSIIFRDSQNAEMERFTFDYYESNESYSGYPAFGRAKDLWGYFNGRTSFNSGTGVNIIPVTQIERIENTDPFMYNVGDLFTREVVFASKVTGMIKRIHYPTGGQSEFIYENNKYRQAGQVKDGPGIRVQKIISRDGKGGTTSREFKYGTGEDGIGELIWWPDDTDFFTLQYITPVVEQQYLEPSGKAAFFDGEQYRWRVYTSEPVKSLEAAYRLPVYYRQVTEYVHSSDNQQNNGKTVYDYSPISDAERTWKDLPPSSGSNLHFRLQSFTFPEWAKPNLVYKTVYKRNPGTAPSYTRVLTQTYKYSKYKETVIPQAWAYKLHRLASGAMDLKEIFAATEESTAGAAQVLPWNVLNVMQYNLRSAILKLDEETVLTAENVETKTVYRYDNPDHLLPTRTEVIKSDGSKEITYTSYPDDYPSGTVFIDNMKKNSSHLVAYPIEQVKMKETGSSGIILSGNINKYLPGGKGLTDVIMQLDVPTPLTLSSFKFSNRSQGQLPPSGTATTFVPYSSYRPLISYGSNYDIKGNPLQVTPDMAPSISYIWDYNYQYPIAKIQNAVQADVAYAGFESDGKGNWTYSGSPLTDATAPTGKKVYNLSNGVISKSGLISSKRYVLSYWAKSASAGNISGGAATAVKSQNGWTLYSRVASGLTSIQLSGTILVDDVRLLPEDALMTSYTYEPLTGMTSITDVKETTTHYQYDDFGRLSRIKDDRGHIVKSYSYHYTPPVFFSNRKSAVFKKNDCGAGFTSGPITYEVTERSYTSNISQQDADAKAQNEVDTKGQLYANRVGTCFTYTNDEMRQSFNKNNCTQGTIGSAITYVVPAGRYSSGISKEDANQMAQADIEINGQAYANTNGTCLTNTFKNVAMSAAYQKSCGFGYAGNMVTYSVPAGKHTSTISQEDADNKARLDLSMNGQSYANTHGYCNQLSTTTVTAYQNTSASNVKIRFSNRKGSVEYNIPGGFSSFSLPMDTYDIVITQDNYWISYNFSLNGNSVRGSTASWTSFQVSGSLNVSIN